VTMGGTEAIVLEQLQALRRSLARIDAHRTTLAGRLPLGAAALERLDDADLVRIEALMKKFEQFVDDLRRVARGVLLLAAEDVEGRSHRQLLDRLASLGVIGSAEAVVKLIALRNRLTHDYSSAPDKQAAMVNALHEKAGTLAPLLAGIEDYVRRNGLLPTAAP
jgi:hypothetical protein